METEPLLGLGYIRRETYAADPTSDRRESSDSTMSTSTRRWGWHEDEEVPHPVDPAPATVASTTAPKKPKGIAALVKWGKGLGHQRRLHEREWNRP